MGISYININGLSNTKMAYIEEYLGNNKNQILGLTETHWKGKRSNWKSCESIDKWRDKIAGEEEVLQ